MPAADRRLALVWTVLCLALVGAAPGGWTQGQDSRIAVPPAFLDENGNRVNDILEAKIETNTLLGPGTVPLPGLEARKPFANLLIDFDHAPTPADVAAVRQMGCEVHEVWHAALFGLHAWMAPDAVSAGGVPRLAALPGLVWVEESHTGYLALYYSTRQTRARQCWARPTAVDGDPSIRLAIIDSGIDGAQMGSTHPDFTRDGTTSKIAAWKDVAGFYADPGDRLGHGSHVAGIAAGTGRACGIATGSGRLEQTFANYFEVGVTPKHMLFRQVESMPVNTTGLHGAEARSWLWWYCGRYSTGNTYTHEFHNSADAVIGTPRATDPGSWGEYQSCCLTAPIPDDTVDSLYWGSAWKNFGDNGYADYYYVVKNAGPQVAIGDGRNLVSGVAPECDLVGVRIADDSETLDSAIVLDGIEWLTTEVDGVMNCERHQIVAANLSFAFDAIDTSIDTAVRTAVEAGVVCCAAAGNLRQDPSSTKRIINSPGRTPYALTVAATSEFDKVTNYSCYGADGSGKPDVVAPGGSVVTYRNITSVETGDGEYIPARYDGQTPLVLLTDKWGDDYTGLTGTSMACPHVTGVVGLVLDALRIQADGGTYWAWNQGVPYYPTSLMRALNVKALILATATETDTTAEAPPNPGVTEGEYDRGPKDRCEGYGRVNADAAVSAVLDEMPIQPPGGTGLAFDFGSDMTARKCWARHCHLARGLQYVFSMEVPVGCDADLYLYDDEGDSDGDPVIVASSTWGYTFGNTETFTRPVITPGDHTLDTYYLVAKLVSGSGTMNVTNIIITPAKVSGLAPDVRDGRACLKWEVAHPGSLAGFHVYSTSDPHGRWDRCNDRLIPLGGRAMAYEPRGLLPGQTRYYRLESVDVYGCMTDHGFVKLTAPSR